MNRGKMRAVRCTGYGPPDVLELVETEVPAPKENELRIAVKASAVTASDIFIRSSDIPLQYRIPMRFLIGIRKPRRPILGLVFSGVVDSVGSKIERFRPGDRVYGMTGFRFGAYAQYMCLKETDSKSGCVAPLPEKSSFEEATASRSWFRRGFEAGQVGHPCPPDSSPMTLGSRQATMLAAWWCGGIAEPW
mgnify:CR=1 FL=1